MVSFRKNSFLLKVVNLVITITFLSSSIMPSFVRAQDLVLPAPAQFVNLTTSYSFPVLKGLRFDPNDPFKINFIVDTADQKQVSEEEAARLIRYFLAGLTIPDEDLWVNMSPYESNRIIPRTLAETDAGKDLLGQDYILKQLSSSLTYPESDTGKTFWTKTYQEVQKIANTTKLPVNTFNKIWIMPDKAEVYENGNIAVVAEASLKVMLEEDYLAMKNNIDSIKKQKSNMQETLIEKVNKVSSDVVRDLVLPKINTEVNSGRNFATLRQIYHSLIMAAWFKQKFKDSIYRYYIDKGKVKGIDLKDKNAKDKIYSLYLQAVKKGIYNYIKTDYDPSSHRNIKRLYFSGGTALPMVRATHMNKASSAAINNVLDSGGTKINIFTRFNADLGSAQSPIGAERTKISASPIQLKVRTMQNQKKVISEKKIDSGFAVVDWNVPVEDGKVTDELRIQTSLPTLEKALIDSGLQYLFVATHSGRPKGKGYEEAFSLKPMVEKAKELLKRNDVEIVLLPYDLAEAEKKIAEAKQTFAGKKIIFVFENIRFYPEEKAKDANVRKSFEEKLIGLTGRSTDKLVYINEASAKIHRGLESSMEMVKLFPPENRAAGITLQEEINKSIAFEEGVTGKRNAIFGGAKWDKFDNIGEIADNIEKTGGQLFVVGALANPLLAAQGKDVGNSLMPKDLEAQDVNRAINTLVLSESDEAQAEEDGLAFKVLAPVDFIVEGQEQPQAELSGSMKQVDIGPQTIAMIKEFFASLKPGDGVIINGGAGMFEKYLEGTKQMVLAASDAADRGVLVFAAGGDMNSAIKAVEANCGKKVSEKIIRSEGGGSLLQILGKGMMALPALSALVASDEAKEKVPATKLVSSFLKEAFPNAIVLEPSISVPKDTSISEGNRAASLDLRSTGNGLRVEIPEAENPQDLTYAHYGAIPIIVSRKDISRALKIRLGKKEITEKNVSAAIIAYLKEKANKTGLAFFDEQGRSHALENKGSFVLDMASNIGVYPQGSGDLLIYIPFWAQNTEVIDDLKNTFAGEKELKELPSGWNKNVTIATTDEAFDFLADNEQRFFEEFKKGNFESLPLLTRIINTINPEKLISENIDGIEYDPVLGVFISQKDKNASEKFMGANLQKFMESMSRIEMLSGLVYFLTSPSYDKVSEKGVAIDNPDLQEATTRFYYRIYKALDDMAVTRFKDIQIFEPLRRQIGIYANALNKDLNKFSAIDVNSASAEELIQTLINYKVNLTVSEINNLKAVYAGYQGEAIWYDVLQLSEIFNEDNFVKAFPFMKIGNSRQVKVENRSYEAYDGTGRIARNALAFRLVDDIRRSELNQLGRYLIRSRSIKGNTKEEKLLKAAATVKEMLNDDVIKASDLTVILNNEPVRFSKLLADGRVSFAAQDKVLPAKLDYTIDTPVESIYPVNIMLDGKVVGVVYCLDNKEFTDGLKKKLGSKKLYNIPRPLIVADSEDFFFGIMLDATPGGVEIGGMTQEEAKEKGIKFSGKSAMEMVGTDKVEIPDYKLDAGNELEALRGLAKQVANKRLSKGKFLIYVKTQIAKKLLLPLGGGINLSSAFMWKLPRMQAGGMRYMNPTSCSTTGGTYVSKYILMFSGLGKRAASLLGLTFHMYTGGDKVGPYGHQKAGSTGAAMGVKQQEELEQAIFTSARVPTAQKNGEIDIVGGSVFDLLWRLPYSAKKQVVIDFLDRVSSQFPEHIKMPGKDLKKNGVYRWEDTITGQSTGSIVYPELIKQITPNTLRIVDAYDNEFSYSSHMAKLVLSLDELTQRGNDKAERFKRLAIVPVNKDSKTQQTFEQLLQMGSTEQMQATIAGLDSTGLAKLGDYATYMGNAADILVNSGQTSIYLKGLQARKAQIEELINGRLRTEAINRASAAKRTPIIGGNWKMALGTKKEAKQLLLQVAKEIKDTQGVDVVVAPSFVHLETVAGALHELEMQGEIPIGLIKLAAQNMYAEEKGAFTGGMSVAQLKDLEVTYVILGHSELRRNSKQELTGESDSNVNRKVKAALKNGLTPIVCVGESWPEREAGKTNELVGAMIDNSLAGLTSEEAAKIVVAYEPVWAIGTGKSATPEQAEEVHYFIRGKLLDNFGENAASIIPIQYGGSVDSAKIAGLIAKPDIDGGLVGGASLKPKDFGGIVKGTEKALETASSALAPIKRVGILTGGGPASGHNQVIYSVVKEAAARGIEIVAIPQGWKGLMSDELVEQARPLTLVELDEHRTKGGTIIKTERKNPYGKKERAASIPDKVWANIQKLGLDAVLGLGGDDTASVSYWLQQDHPDFPIIALPKTMDNDMPLPDNASTYGFDSFTEAATKAVKDGIVDAKSTSRVLVVESFGRKAGFAPLRIGANVDASRTLIPEEKEVDLEKLINDIKNYHKKHKYAVVIVSEGVKINENVANNKAILEKVFAAKPLAGKAYELAKEAEVDDFGNPKLQYAGMIISAILEVGLKEDGIKISNAGKLDYLFRSADTSKVDLAKCDLLGRAAIEYLVKGEKNKILYDHNDEVKSMDLVQKLGGREVDHLGTDNDEYKKANQALFDDEANAFSASPLTTHQAITTLVQTRDSGYLDAVRAANSAKFVSQPEKGKFAAAHDVFEALRANGQATIAVNIVSYNQIEGHIRAAMDKDAVLILEVARSQLGYALNEVKVMEYVKKAIEKIENETGKRVPPIIVHGDHIQYTEASFKVFAMLEAEFAKSLENVVLKDEHKELFKQALAKGVEGINDIDQALLEAVQKKLKDNAAGERKKVAEINERLIKSGFTSIAIDASTLYDQYAGDLVLDHYTKNGTAAEKLVVKPK